MSRYAYHAEGTDNVKKLSQGAGIYLALAGTGILVQGIRGIERKIPDLYFEGLRIEGGSYRDGPDLELIGVGIVMLLISLLLVFIPIVVERRKGTNADPRSKRSSALKLKGAAIAFWFFAMIAIQFATKLDGKGAKIASAAAGFGLAAIGARIFARAQRDELIPASDALLADNRPPVLYLRSFQLDSKSSTANTPLSANMLTIDYWVNRRPWSFEELICAAFREVGPVVALGDPGDNLPPLGASRDYAVSAEWQERFLDLARRSKIVCICVGNSPGLFWEIQHIIATKACSQIVLLVPQPRSFDFDETWTKFVCYMKELGVTLPDTLRHNVLALRLDSSWRGVPAATGLMPTIDKYKAMAMMALNSLDGDTGRKVEAEHSA